MRKTVVLMILDGWGEGEMNESNPIYTAKPKVFNSLKYNYPCGLLQASGIAVGLPWNEEGNSEVGHLTLGAGRVIYQNYPRIALSIRDGSFFENKALKGAFENAKKNNSSVNIVGLLSAPSTYVHSSTEHLMALIKFAKQEGVKYNLHLFTDGRDSPPYSSLELIKGLGEEVKNVASLAGRYWAMDRAKHWDRTEKTYKVLVGDSPSVENYEESIKKTHKKLNDEYVEPMFLKPDAGIKDNDSVIFFNFREDRMRQMVETFINKDFKEFPVKKFENLYIATMISYRDDFKVNVAFPPEEEKNPLGKILADNGKIQLRLAETEKYAHITYFFNGLVEKPFENEFRILIPSRMDLKPDDHPEMRANEITNRLIQAIEEKAFDFILVNYANSDIIAHTGNYEATKKVVEIIDQMLEKVITTVLGHDAVLMLTSDHGNIEKMFDPMTGQIETKHNNNPVPFYLIAKNLQRQKDPLQAEKEIKNVIGVLSDIAPTVLELLEVKKAEEMTGQNLVKYLNI
ncbi:MAG: 2,3-bisphosphoglycerate-independent phosphoglycerate mutase [Candidatus Paceibacterota bacterium]|jgi:2,3-bisphosphoglycerate-independent phosphoglycerate mutase